MRRITIRFYEELNDFLPSKQRKTDLTLDVREDASIKSIIEITGVPHTEVDLVLVDGVSVDFSFRPQDGARVSVYPVFESFDLSAVSKVRPEPLRVVRFVVDVHLGTIPKQLRMLGFDTTYSNAWDDEMIAHMAAVEKRIVLTRDRGLLKRRSVTHGYCVRSKHPDEQLCEIVSRFHLEGQIRPYTRCLECNIPLEPAKQSAIEERVPVHIARKYDSFNACPRCGKIFWRGTHWELMKEKPGIGRSFT